MAKKRMFTLSVVDSDSFLDMPLSTQALYFHLNMRADDDGFIGNPKRICRLVGASDDDMKLLLAKRFVLSFEDGVIVIKHWRMHNTIRADRYTPTVYQDEKDLLKVKENKAYSLNNGVLATECQPMVSTDIDIGIGIEQDKDIDIGIDKGTEKNIDLIKEIVAYLNDVAGTHFKYQTDKTKKLINARFKEGFTVEEFKAVIDKKCKSWIGTDMEKYLRPETLFGNKFEGYLNEKENISPNRPNNFNSNTGIDWSKV